MAGDDRTLKLWDFGRPARRRALLARLGTARQALAKNVHDPAALAVLGRSYKGLFFG